LEKMERFEKNQVVDSKTMGYTRDLWNAVLKEDRLYTKEEAKREMEKYLNKSINGRENE
jgi:ABC-type oligopeptide transport system ATPase subunit